MHLSDLAKLAAAGEMIPDAPIQARRSVEIDAPADEVWRTLTRVPEWERWHPYLKDARLDGPFEPGARLTYGRLLKHKLRIAHARKRELAMIYGTFAGYTGITRWDVERIDDHRTKVVFTESSDGFLIRRLYGEAALGTHLQRWLASLKAEAERRHRRLPPPDGR